MTRLRPRASAVCADRATQILTAASTDLDLEDARMQLAFFHNPFVIDWPLRFLTKIAPQKNGCWLWLGFTDPGGYGQFSCGAPTVAAHRAAWKFAGRPLPEGFGLHHRCFTPACVNPDHLELVTHREHAKRHHVLKDACKHGHPYTPESTYLYRNGTKRDCRICRRERWKRHRAKEAARTTQ